MIDQVTGLLSGAGLAASPDAGLSSGNTRDTPEAIAKAATQFESLLIGQILKASRESDGSGWLGTDEDDGSSALAEMSEQQVAQTLAANGGLGLGKMIASGLAKTAHVAIPAGER